MNDFVPARSGWLLLGLLVFLGGLLACLGPGALHCSLVGTCTAGRQEPVILASLFLLGLFRAAVSGGTFVPVRLVLRRRPGRAGRPVEEPVPTYLLNRVFLL